MLLLFAATYANIEMPGPCGAACLALGRNTYRNLVSSCLECNSQKGEKQAEDFLRSLYRKRRLTDAELNGRLRSLDALVAGKLRPAIATSGR